MTLFKTNVGTRLKKKNYSTDIWHGSCIYDKERLRNGREVLFECKCVRKFKTKKLVSNDSKFSNSARNSKIKFRRKLTVFDSSCGFVADSSQFLFLHHTCNYHDSTVTHFFEFLRWF